MRKRTKDAVLVRFRDGRHFAQQEVTDVIDSAT